MSQFKSNVSLSFFTSQFQLMLPFPSTPSEAKLIGLVENNFSNLRKSPCLGSKVVLFDSQAV